MVDKTKIGARVGAGFQHVVYEYDTGSVIKIPRVWMRISTSLAQKQKELEIIQEYLGDYLPETSVFPFRNSYCYIQERVRDITPLTISHKEKHRSALDYFLKQNERLIREQRLTADLLGGKAYMSIFASHIHSSPVLSGNVVLQEDIQKLRLLDTDMLHTSPFNVTHPREIGFALVSYVGYLLTKQALKHYDIL